MKTKQAELLSWAVDTLGTIAIQKEERVKCFAEEAIELCQSCGLDPGDIVMIIDYVYNRDRGNVAQELGQTALSLSLLAEVYDINLDDELQVEFDRVRQFDKSYWQARQNKKAALGIGLFCDDKGTKNAHTDVIV